MLDERQRTFLIMTDQLLVRMEMVITAAQAGKALLGREFGKESQKKKA